VNPALTCSVLSCIEPYLLNAPAVSFQFRTQENFSYDNNDADSEDRNGDFTLINDNLIVKITEVVSELVRT
jgi:hypothetical protein